MSTVDLKRDPDALPSFSELMNIFEELESQVQYELSLRNLRQVTLRSEAIDRNAVLKLRKMLRTETNPLLEMTGSTEKRVVNLNLRKKSSRLARGSFISGDPEMMPQAGMTLEETMSKHPLQYKFKKNPGPKRVESSSSPLPYGASKEQFSDMFGP